MLQLFKTLWGHTGTLELAVSDAVAAQFDGIEGPSPESRSERRELRAQLDDANLEFVAEICTGLGPHSFYVPRRTATPGEHLSDFCREAERAVEMRALFITSMAGCDAWTLTQNVEFFGAAHEIARECGLMASFEIHRSRSLFNPWVTRDVLHQLPDLRITCDFSHWCVVCERLIDTEPDVLQVCASRAHHVHARVGNAQSAQVSDPRAPEHADALAAHERWWDMIWDAQEKRGAASTMTPEFGPDGYLQTLPYTQMPVADLNEINVWIGHRQRERFAARTQKMAVAV